ncbi:unnamed protein product [Effrenium voratum]|nr:unnamed protein product [Effrenium voratum]
MGALGNSAELESELIKRNREIAKVRDDLIKQERRLQEARLRNDDLLERLAVLDAEVTTKTGQLKDSEQKVADLQERLETQSSDLQKAQEELAAQGAKFQADLAAQKLKWQEEAADEKGMRSELEKLQAELQRELTEEQRQHSDCQACAGRGGSDWPVSNGSLSTGQAGAEPVAASGALLPCWAAVRFGFAPKNRMQQREAGS